ncbi:MAG: MoaF N-terminal domain-containing protein [Lachnospiraceae bacterium]|nr:MoaF N-terminal domain-containing protein [Lachnospiraceae bacterium]
MAEETKKPVDAPAPFEGASQYRVPYSRELEGKNFDLVFDDGFEMTVIFPGRDKIMFNENGGTFVVKPCHVLKAEDTVYFLMVDRRDTKPRSGFILIIDTKEGLVTGNFMLQGARAEKPALVTRIVRFGAIREGDKPLPKERHGYTEDLVGRKIEWQYNPSFKITHIYLEKNGYCFAITDELRAEIAARRAEQGRSDEPINPIKEPCIFLKIRKNLYVFSWIEEVSGSGTQGFALINTDRLTDVGAFFGNNPKGEPEGYMFCAYGKWIKDRLPEEDFFAEQKGGEKA